MAEEIAVITARLSFGTHSGAHRVAFLVESTRHTLHEIRDTRLFSGNCAFGHQTRSLPVTG
jgi:hypothetical protein